ncbi:MAG: ABC transporter ATP-binding protein [Hyphomonadaceae bacterium]|nr:ABC transporter ATP-binding protein [Hyphomonadaceae bacterium]
MAHLTLTDATVTYPVYSSSRQRSILGFAANRVSFGRIARDAGSIPRVDALHGVSFDLKEGDRLALVGRNGSGKSTLLKVCAGLVWPDSGRVEVGGSRASLLSIGAGLDQDISGFDNVEAVARLLGVPKSARKLMQEDVAEFTELGDFLNLPIRTYSAGMMVRLMFALATTVDREILVIDEIIGAGDAHFVEKAAQRIQAMMNRAKILIMATHSGEIAAQMCNKAIWVDAGRAIMTGEPEEVWDAYANQRYPRKGFGVAA